MRIFRALLSLVTLALVAIFVAGWIGGVLPWWAALALVLFLVVHRLLWTVRLNA